MADPDDQLAEPVVGFDDKRGRSSSIRLSVEGEIEFAGEAESMRWKGEEGSDPEAVDNERDRLLRRMRTVRGPRGRRRSLRGAPRPSSGFW